MGHWSWTARLSRYSNCVREQPGTQSRCAWFWLGGRYSGTSCFVLQPSISIMLVTSTRCWCLVSTNVFGNSLKHGRTRFWTRHNRLPRGTRRSSIVMLPLKGWRIRDPYGFVHSSEYLHLAMNRFAFGWGKHYICHITCSHKNMAYWVAVLSVNYTICDMWGFMGFDSWQESPGTFHVACW